MNATEPDPLVVAAEGPKTPDELVAEYALLLDEKESLNAPPATRTGR